MDGTPDAPRPVPATLEAELDRSQADQATGRVRPLGPILAAIQERASRRIKTRDQTAHLRESRG